VGVLLKGFKKTYATVWWKIFFVLKNPWSGSLSRLDPDSATALIRIQVQQNVCIRIRIQLIWIRKKCVHKTTLLIDWLTSSRSLRFRRIPTASLGLKKKQWRLRKIYGLPSS
jgi:hypothetical protein